jgi:hypothetical protein
MTVEPGPGGPTLKDLNGAQTLTQLDEPWHRPLEPERLQLVQREHAGLGLGSAIELSPSSNSSSIPN